MDADSLRLLFDLLRTALIHSLDIYFQKIYPCSHDCQSENLSISD